MKRTLITNASWEPRFHLGSIRILEKYPEDYDQLVCLVATDFEDWTIENRLKVKAVCEQRKIDYIEHGYVLTDPLSAWRSVTIEFLEIISSTSFSIDVTTMPRLIIWTFLSLVRQSHVAQDSFFVFYSRPADYGDDWVSRDPRKPFMVPRCGGITKLDCQTALFVISGYDMERIGQLMTVFEPAELIIAVQTGSQFGNKPRNLDEVLKLRAEFPSAVIVDLDAYTSDCGYNQLKNILAPYLEEYNVVASSLGPKLSSVALMRIYSETESLSLVYTPSADYNRDYSKGIGETVECFFMTDDF